VPDQASGIGATDEAAIKTYHGTSVPHFIVTCDRPFRMKILSISPTASEALASFRHPYRTGTFNNHPRSSEPTRSLRMSIGSEALPCVAIRCHRQVGLTVVTSRSRNRRSRPKPAVEDFFGTATAADIPRVPSLPSSNIENGGG
jgi:hypothetical protein